VVQRFALPVVGIKCADGVVVGSDCSTTFSVNQHFRTIEQKAQKTFLVGNDIIFPGTGSVGLGQRFEDVLTQTRQNPQWKETSYQNLGRIICANAIKDFQSTGAGVGKFGALVAFTCGGEPHLCEFGIEDFQPEFKIGETWFASIGSGQPIVDPFLGLWRRVFFPSKGSCAHLEDGVFAAAWALDWQLN
jgi:20S proteasome alpha/beta subunit